MPSKWVIYSVVFCGLAFLKPLAVAAETQHTNLAFVNVGAGLESLSYYEFPMESSVDFSSAITGSFVSASTVVVRWKNLGLQARGNLGPVTLGGREQWFKSSDNVQRNDLSYRLTRAVVAVGLVFPNGLEPYLGYWYAKETQIRKDFSTPGSTPSAVSIERIWSRGIVMGLQGVFHDREKRSLIHFYGDLVIVPDAGSLQARTTNTVFPGTDFHSWSLGIEARGSYGWTFGQGPGKLLVSLQGNFILLYNNGEERSEISLEWPPNLTMGWGLMLQLGGGWFSLDRILP